MNNFLELLGCIPFQIFIFTDFQSFFQVQHLRDINSITILLLYAYIYHYQYYSNLSFVSYVIISDRSMKIWEIFRHYFKLSFNFVEAAIERKWNIIWLSCPKTDMTLEIKPRNRRPLIVYYEKYLLALWARRYLKRR